MTGSRARRHPLVLFALAFCLLLSPALTQAAELHELVHELSGEHVLDGSGQHHHERGADHEHGATNAHGDDGDSDARDPVHLLVHCVHTCGGAFAGAPAASVVRTLSLETAVALPVAAAVPDPPVSTLLRPPRAR